MRESKDGLESDDTLQDRFFCFNTVLVTDGSRNAYWKMPR